MKNTIALIAIAGIATAATAGGPGETYSLSIAGAAASVDATSGATITIDIIGDSSVGTWMLGGAFVLSSGSNSMVTGMTWTVADWSGFNEGTGVYDGNGNHEEVIYGQLVFLPVIQPGAGSDLGLSIGSFVIDIAAGSAGQLDLSLLLGSGDALRTVGDGVLGASSDGALSLNGASITITPAPSAMALLGLGGIAAGRRRR